MNTALFATLVVGLSVLGAVGGLLLVWRKVELRVLEVNNEVAGFIIAVLGVAYAVLLAFVVVVVWEQFDGAKTQVEQEANKLADVYRMARVLPEPAQSQLRQRISAYVLTVVDEEWPLMAAGKASERAWDQFDDLWQAVTDFQPREQRELVVYDQVVSRLNEIGDSRRLRLLAARDTINPMLWVVLIGGGAISIAFTFFFGLRNRRAHLLMVAGLAGTIAFVLATIAAFDRPFTGDVSVQPEAFHLVMDNFQRELQARRSTGG